MFPVSASPKAHNRMLPSVDLYILDDLTELLLLYNILLLDSVRWMWHYSSQDEYGMQIVLVMQHEKKKNTFPVTGHAK